MGFIGSGRRLIDTDGGARDRGLAGVYPLETVLGKEMGELMAASIAMPESIWSAAMRWSGSKARTASRVRSHATGAT
jgi:hypothetical protein